MSYYQTPLVITRKTPKNSRSRRKIEISHGRQYVTNVKDVSKLQNFNEHRKFVQDLKKASKPQILRGIPRFLDRVQFHNLLPDFLFEIYEALFFDKFPEGQIWYVERDQTQRYNIVAQSLRVEAEFRPDANFGQVTSQGYAIDFEDVIISIGNEIPLLVRYPFLQGSTLGTANGTFFFLVDDPIDIEMEDKMTLREDLFDIVGSLYTDSRSQPFRSSRARLSPLTFASLARYLRWYLASINGLIEFVYNINDPKIQMLTSLTLARICSDTYMLQLFYQPYPRKMVFPLLVDKYANLVRKTSGSQTGEVEIWKNLLSIGNFERRARRIMGRPPRHLSWLSSTREFLREVVRQTLNSRYQEPIRRISSKKEREALDILRNDRNSHHGYLLDDERRRQLFLSHTGEIPNYLPDYAYNLWHMLISNPWRFIGGYS